MLFKRNKQKKCGKCGEFKSLDNYSFRDSEHKIMRGVYNKCENLNKAKWYKKNRKTHIKNVGEQRKTRTVVRCANCHRIKTAKERRWYQR